MNLNAAALRLMVAKGLTLEDVAEIVSANEKTRDPTAAERQARCRARKPCKSQRDVTRDTPPNERNLTPTKLTPTSRDVGPKPLKSRGTRLPADWALPREWLQWAAERRGWSDKEIAEEAEVFANYWQAKGGAGACHTDWFKTWRNWVIRSHRADGEIPKYTAPKTPAEAHEWWLGQAVFFRRIGREDDAKRCDEHAQAIEDANPELEGKVSSIVAQVTKGMRVSKLRAT